jgi:hypothetical protein
MAAAKKKNLTPEERASIREGDAIFERDRHKKPKPTSDALRIAREKQGFPVGIKQDGTANDGENGGE